MLLMFDLGEEFPPLPWWNYYCFVGVHYDLPTSSRTVHVEGVIVFILDCFLLLRVRLLTESFPPIVGRGGI